jgi:hypothetical protein
VTCTKIGQAKLLCYKQCSAFSIFLAQKLKTDSRAKVIGIMDSVDARVNVITETGITSTVVSIIQSEISPFIEGDADEYEFEVPESNHPVDNVILARAEENNRRIAIRPSRLQKLQELEKDLPAFIARALDEIKQEKLAALHKKDKLDPTASNVRAKRYLENNRDKINARRREKRKAAKQAVQPESSDTKIEHIDGGAVVSFGR